MEQQTEKVETQETQGTKNFTISNILENESVPTQLIPFVELQDKLNNIGSLNEEKTDKLTKDVSEVAEWCIKTFAEEYYEEVANSICRFSERRPKCRTAFNLLAYKLCKEFGSKFIASLLHTIDLSSGALLRSLYTEYKVITADQCKHKCQENYNLYFFFLPEHLSGEIPIKIPDQKVQESLVQRAVFLSQDGFAKYFESCKYGYETGSLGYGIKFDDVELVKEKLISVDEYTLTMSLFDGFSSTKLGILEASAYYGSYNVFKFLLLNHDIYDLSTKEMENICRCAVMGGNMDIIKLCEWNGLSFESMLFTASQFMHNDVFEHICSTYEESINKFSVFDYNGNNRVFVYMIFEQRVDPRLKSPSDRKSLLHSAAKFGSLSITKYLIDVGVHPCAEDSKHVTVLHDSARYGNYMVCKYLLYKGADPNAVADNGCSPLHFASAANQLQIVKLLVSHGANPKYRDPLNKLLPSEVTSNIEIKKYLQQQEKQE